MENTKFIKKQLLRIAEELDPDCPDYGAYIDGHCCIVELVKRHCKQPSNTQMPNPQCIFCGYNGPGYYQAHTHKKDCPFYDIGGAEEREHALVVFAKKGWLQFCKKKIKHF